MQKFKITFILFAITALFISCSKNSAKQENDASVKKNISKNTDAQKIYPIKILELKPEKINDYLQVVGITSPDIKINLSSFSGGLVEKMYYNEGAFVNKGDTLAEVDLQLQLIRLKKFMAEFQDVKSSYEKDKKLYESNALPQTKFISSKSRYESMLQDIEQIKVLIDRAIIKAPFDAFVIKKNAEVGEIVPAGYTLYILNKMDKLKIHFELPANDIGYFKENQTELTINLDAYPDDIIKAKIKKIAKEVNPKNLTYEAEAEIENRNYKYKSGLLGKVKILKQSLNNAVVLPKDAVINFEDGGRVYVYNKETNSVSQRKVKLAVSENDKIQIIDGLKFGEYVVIAGQYELYENAPVKVVE